MAEKTNVTKRKKPRKKAGTAQERIRREQLLETVLVDVVSWLLKHGFWQVLIGLVVLIFAWRIASHYFP